MAVKSILIICQGNICRSPMAEGFFSYQTKCDQFPIIVSSAGLSALVDHPADFFAKTVMQHHGIDISAHRARQVTKKLIGQADLIFVMTHYQRTNLERQFLTARGKTFLLGHWHQFEIKDPLNQPDAIFEQVYQQIEISWQDWKSRILSC